MPVSLIEGFQIDNLKANGTFFAGHMAPHDQPKWTYDMLLRFTTGKGFMNRRV